MKRLPPPSPTARAALALAHILQLDPSLNDLPITWQVGAIGVVANVEYGHPDGHAIIERLAALLELPTRTDEFPSTVQPGSPLWWHGHLDGRALGTTCQASAFYPAPAAAEAGEEQ